jgi:hypothetical protein
MSMWRLAQEKEIYVSNEEFQQVIEKARHESREQIKSTCLVVADALRPI